VTGRSGEAFLTCTGCGTSCLPTFDVAEWLDITDMARWCDMTLSDRGGSSLAGSDTATVEGTRDNPQSNSRLPRVVEEGRGLAPVGRAIRLLRKSARYSAIQRFV
jgi:hypothetical protein